MFDSFIKLSREIFGPDAVPLHRPVFKGNERRYLVECIDSNFVSSVGKKVEEFENKVADFTGANYAVAMVNGTSALHIAIKLAGVDPGDEVISQAVTFIATCNAITYAGATPIFIDVDLDTMGMSPIALQRFLKEHAVKKENGTFNVTTGKRISACIPMHTFGIPCRIEEILSICKSWGIALVEDAAESLGSYYGGRHTGTFGEMSALSFNGNKLITTGGGGMLLTNDSSLALQAKHVTTTAKLTHPYEFDHDEIGFNYRMPNLNAALGCAQMERLSEFLAAKKELALKWANFFDSHGTFFAEGIPGTSSNHWLNAIALKDKSERNKFLDFTNKNGVMTRPIWKLMSRLSMFKGCQNDGLSNSIWLEERVVNIPSSVPDGVLKEFHSKDL